MNYPYAISPYMQSAMAQAAQAIMSGGPLPPNCFVVTIPIQQAPQMLPQLMMNYGFNGNGPMMIPQQSSYYNQLYQPQLGPYPYQLSLPAPAPSTTVVPYSNVYTPGYNYPVVPYTGYNNQVGKKTGRGKRNPYEPHSNIYNSSSFDSDMENLSWSRLFGRHHNRQYSKQQNQDPAAINYDNKSKQRNKSRDSLASTTSSSTTSDETIRRVNVSNKQTNEQTTTSSKQQTKSSLPFKYSSEFVPGVGKQQQQQQSQKSTRKEPKVRSDDVFVVKKSPPASQQQ